jgi:hypothetical protein
MSHTVVKTLASGAALLLVACQSASPAPSVQTASPVSAVCEAKQSGTRFASCAAPSSGGQVAMAGDRHVGQRFAVRGSFEGVLR